MDKDKEAQWNPHPEIDELPVIKCLPVCNFVWISLVTIMMVLHWSASFDDGATLTPLQNLQNGAKKTDGFRYLFNVVGTKGDTVVVPQSGSLPIELDQVERYEVCCRSVTTRAISCASSPKTVLSEDPTTGHVSLAFFVADERWAGAACVLLYVHKN